MVEFEVPEEIDISDISAEELTGPESEKLNELETTFEKSGETMTEADLRDLNRLKVQKKQAASIEKIKNKLNITDVDTAKRVYKLLNDVQTKSFIDTTTNEPPEPPIEKLSNDNNNVGVNEVNKVDTLRQKYKTEISDRIRDKLKQDFKLGDAQIENIHELVLDSLFKIKN